MPITRTPIIDDDGSGTTGTVIDNAWKQEFYAQIDAALAVVQPVMGSFTLVDVSGAALGNLGTGQYAKVGQIVMIMSSVIFPGTSDTRQNLLGGLPFPCIASAYGGLYLGYGPVHLRTWIQPGVNTFQLVDGVTTAIKTNAQLSGASGHFHGLYFTSS